MSPFSPQTTVISTASSSAVSTVTGSAPILSSGVANDAVGQHIQTRVNELRAVFPLMKLVTGELFEKEHWAFLFHKVFRIMFFPNILEKVIGFEYLNVIVSQLKLGTEVTLSTLTAGHLLHVAATLLQIHTAVRELSSRAQGEVALREALAELRTWQDQTEFKVRLFVFFNYY